MFWPKIIQSKKAHVWCWIEEYVQFCTKKNSGISLILGILFIADKVKERKRLVQRYGYQGAGIINIH